MRKAMRLLTFAIKNDQWEKIVRTRNTIKVLRKFKKRKTVYIRVRAFKYDSTGNRVYPAYSSRKTDRM